MTDDEFVETVTSACRQAPNGSSRRELDTAIEDAAAAAAGIVSEVSAHAGWR